MKPARVVQLVGATLMFIMVIFYLATLRSHLLWIVPTVGVMVAGVLIVVGFGLERRDRHRAVRL